MGLDSSRDLQQSAGGLCRNVASRVSGRTPDLDAQVFT